MSVHLINNDVLHKRPPLSRICRVLNNKCIVICMKFATKFKCRLNFIMNNNS
jgi:hypothetical protein